MRGPFPGRQSRLRTFRVLGQTLYHSARIAGKALAHRLTNESAQQEIDDWCAAIMRTARVDLEAFGVENLRPDTPYIYMSNHMSLLDVPAVFATAPGTIRAISKQELRKVPVFGKAMEELGVVFVDRKNTQKAIQQLESAKILLEERGTSLWVAAEGRRSRDGRLYSFKKGGFHVAQQLGIPIVPTWISGTIHVIPPDSWYSRSDQRVTVHYGPPIETTNISNENIECLMADTRRSILQLAKEAGDDDVDTASE